MFYLLIVLHFLGGIGVFYGGMLYVAPHSRECGEMKPWNLWNLETKVIMIVLWNRQRSASVCPLRLSLSTTYEGYEERQFAFTRKYSGFKVSGFQFLLCIGISQFCWNLPMVSEGLFETKWLTKKALHRLSEWGRPRRAELVSIITKLTRLQGFLPPAFAL